MVVSFREPFQRALLDDVAEVCVSQKARLHTCESRLRRTDMVFAILRLAQLIYQELYAIC